MSDPTDPDAWDALRRTLSQAFLSSLHFAIASVDEDGAPLVTPVGTLFLDEPGRAHYFELYATGLGRRLSRDPRVSVLAVDSGRILWLRSLVRGRFVRDPAVRLVGVAARETRPSTKAERSRLSRRLGFARRSPGGRLLWPDLGSEAARTVPVRELVVERIDVVRFGAMPVDAQAFRALRPWRRPAAGFPSAGPGT